MKKMTLIFTMFLIVLMGSFSACKEKEETTKELMCNVENPLTDLPWLKAKVDEITLLSQDNPLICIAIYQCTYGNNETGFLIDEGNIKPFYNCNGEILCIMGGDAGETCSELDIVKQELIWKKDMVEISYSKCTYDDGYMDTISIEGVGYLFVNYVPAELQKDNNVMYIIYNKEDNLTAFSAAYPTEALYNGNICNFPDFAKEWEIPTEGKQIYYKGELYVTGAYLNVPPHIGGDLILTTLLK